MKVPNKKYTYLYSNRTHIVTEANNILSKLENVEECSLENGIYEGNGVSNSFFNLNVLIKNYQWSIQPSLDNKRVRVDDITNHEYGQSFDNIDDAIAYIQKETQWGLYLWVRKWNQYLH